MSHQLKRVKYWINVGFRTKDGNVVFPYNGSPLEPKMSNRTPSVDQIEAHEHALKLAEELAPGEERIVSEGESFVTSIYRINEN